MNNKSRVKEKLSLAPAGYVDVSFPLTNEAVNILCALLFSKGFRFFDERSIFTRGVSAIEVNGLPQAPIHQDIHLT